MGGGGETFLCRSEYCVFQYLRALIPRLDLPSLIQIYVYTSYYDLYYPYCISVQYMLHLVYAPLCVCVCARVCVCACVCVCVDMCVMSVLYTIHH